MSHYGDEPDGTLVVVTAIGCMLLAGLELLALRSDGPEADDPVALLWGMPMAALALAFFAIVLRRNVAGALTLVGLSAGACVLWLGLVAASVG